MNQPIFATVTFGLILNMIMWVYGIWKELDWSEFFRDNYLLPLFLTACGTLTGYQYGLTFGSSLLIGFTLAILICLFYGVRFHSEYTLYKTKPSLNLQSLFRRTSSS